MTVSYTPHTNKRHTPLKEHLFIFSDCESLTEGILFLYRLKLNIKSALYKTESDYRLIIKSHRPKPYFLSLNEFCIKQSSNSFEAAFTKEYGKLLIANNAIKTFGKYFFKGS